MAGGGHSSHVATVTLLSRAEEIERMSTRERKRERANKKSEQRGGRTCMAVVEQFKFADTLCISRSGYESTGKSHNQSVTEVIMYNECST